MDKLIGVVLLVAIAVGLVLGIYWVFWSLWCWVLPQVWADGPENLIRPGYWLFVACVILLSFVGGVLFKSSSNNK